MAKELPYYKFEPSEWENGNIQLFSHAEKGVFIDLCSMYWARLGDLPYKLALQKICGGNATAFNSLCEHKIFEVIDGNIYIKFLQMQLNEFENISETNSKNAKEGWEKRRKQKELSERNATPLPKTSDPNAIRGDEIKEDKKIKDILVRKKEFSDTLQPFLETYGSKMLNEFYLYWTEPTQSKKPKLKFELEKTWSLERRLFTWKQNETKFNKEQPPVKSELSGIKRAD